MTIGGFRVELGKLDSLLGFGTSIAFQRQTQIRRTVKRTFLDDPQWKPAAAAQVLRDGFRFEPIAVVIRRPWMRMNLHALFSTSTATNDSSLNEVGRSVLGSTIFNTPTVAGVNPGSTLSTNPLTADFDFESVLASHATNLSEKVGDSKFLQLTTDATSKLSQSIPGLAANLQGSSPVVMPSLSPADSPKLCGLPFCGTESYSTHPAFQPDSTFTASTPFPPAEASPTRALSTKALPTESSPQEIFPVDASLVKGPAEASVVSNSPTGATEVQVDEIDRATAIASEEVSAVELALVPVQSAVVASVIPSLVPPVASQVDALGIRSDASSSPTLTTSVFEGPATTEVPDNATVREQRLPGRAYQESGADASLRQLVGESQIGSQNGSQSGLGVPESADGDNGPGREGRDLQNAGTLLAGYSASGRSAKLGPLTQDQTLTPRTPANPQSNPLSGAEAGTTAALPAVEGTVQRLANNTVLQNSTGLAVDSEGNLTTQTATQTSNATQALAATQTSATTSDGRSVEPAENPLPNFQGADSAVGPSGTSSPENALQPEVSSLSPVDAGLEPTSRGQTNVEATNFETTTPQPLTVDSGVSQIEQGRIVQEQRVVPNGTETMADVVGKLLGNREISTGRESNVTQIKIEIDPPELGAVMIQITRSQQGTVATVSVANEYAMNQLQSGLQALQSTLDNLGVELQQIQWDSGGEGSLASQRDSSFGGNGQSRDFLAGPGLDEAADAQTSDGADPDIQLKSVHVVDFVI